MMKFVKLTAVNTEVEDAYFSAVRNARLAAEVNNGAASDGAEDDLEQPVVVALNPGAEPVVVPVPENMYFPVTIAIGDGADKLREFYPRKSSGDKARVGTRIVFANGAARPVKESYEEVAAAFAAMPGRDPSDETMLP